MISIIIPVYNSSSTISKTIYSVKNQSFENFEALIINDGSTDNSLEIINESIINDNRFRIINQKNSGVSSARNCGIKNSVFDFIAFIDSDDEWEKDYLEKISILINKFPDYIGFGTYYRRILRYGRETVKVTARFEENELFTISSVTNQLIKGDLPFFTSSIVIKKEILIEIGMFNEQINCGEDLLTWIKVSTFGKIAMLSKNCVNYNITINENGRLRRKNDLIDTFAIEFNKMSNTLPLLEMNLLLSGWFYARYLNALVTENRFTHLKNILSEYKKMIAADPLNLKRISTIILVFIPSKFIDKLLLYKN